jgi:DNA invertase Pin-like site-specific DNA recombinase
VKRTDAAFWFRVSTGNQDSDNQVPDVERFARHHGYVARARYTIADTAYKDGGGPEYKRELARMLTDAHQGRFTVLVVWALDRIVRDEAGGAEAALRLVRQLRERGCIMVSVQEEWLNGNPEIQDLLLAFAGWMGQQESKRRSERVLRGLARREAEDPTFRRGGSPGRTDKKPRKRSGYVARWERERGAS